MSPPYFVYLNLCIFVHGGCRVGFERNRRLDSEALQPRMRQVLLFPAAGTGSRLNQIVGSCKLSIAYTSEVHQVTAWDK